MRFKINLALKPHSKRLLPFNYQYELSSWIYGIIKQADETYSYFLHEKGYQTERKSFKFFCFSNFYIPKFALKQDSIELLCSHISFQISFYLDKASETFVMGLFRNQRGSIGNKFHQIDFEVHSIESKPLLYHHYGEELYLKTISPLVISRKNLKNHDDYLPPTHAEFKDLFLNNLIDKYKATEQDIPLSWQDYPFELEVYEPIRSKLVHIKQNTEKETRVKGYLFNFRLKAPKELLEIGLLAGFGRENAQGFGACEIVEK
ncbi:MAG: CRISPR-associated endoribonuclease Cas6 [Raineya sp.]